MTETATGTRVSVHDLEGDERDAFITAHIARWGFPPIAGAEEPEGETAGDAERVKKLEADVEKWKAMSRKNEADAKKNLDKAEKFDALEESQKTEQQKTADQLAAANARAEKAEAAHTRLEVALDKAPEGMPLARVRKLASRLTGSSKEELEADATELFSEFGGKKDDGENPDGGGDGGDEGETPSGGRGRPTEDLKPGGVPNATPDDTETDPDKLAAKVPRPY